jgi:superfamily II DNA or RNA helicase
MSLGISVAVDDRRVQGQPIETNCTGVLRPAQIKAIEVLRLHDHGVLAATTAFGKTIIAAKLIAERGANALVLVHRRQLMDQWIERLVAFLIAAGQLSERSAAVKGGRLTSSTLR